MCFPSLFFSIYVHVTLQNTFQFSTRTLGARALGRTHYDQSCRKLPLTFQRVPHDRSPQHPPSSAVLTDIQAETYTKVRSIKRNAVKPVQSPSKNCKLEGQVEGSLGDTLKERQSVHFELLEVCWATQRNPTKEIDESSLN